MNGDQLSPAVVLLGMCSKAMVNPYGVDLIGASHRLIFPFFPQHLEGTAVLLGIRKDIVQASGPAYIKVSFIDERHPSETANLELTLGTDTTPSNEAPVTDKPQTRVGVLSGSPLYADNTSYVIVPLPAPPLAIHEPTTVTVTIDDAEGSRTLGRVAFFFQEPPPITEAERQAIMSNPAASKSSRVGMQCRLCHDQFGVYIRLDPNGGPNPRIEENAVPLADAPDNWQCKCGKANFTLTYLKKGMHHLLRHGLAGEEGKLTGHSMSPLYERGQLRMIYAQFQELIASNPPEEEVQQFIQNHPIIWSFLSPIRLFHKPPLLTKHKADFAILTPQKILYFVELERPGCQIHTRAGGFHNELTKAFNQVRDWSMQVAEHRQAVLDQLGLSSKDVLDVRYLVVAGLQCNVPHEVLGKLQQNIPTRDTLFYCFDELAGYLHSVAANLSRL